MERCDKKISAQLNLGFYTSKSAESAGPPTARARQLYGPEWLAGWVAGWGSPLAIGSPDSQ
jgi:hypothetical protein